MGYNLYITRKENLSDEDGPQISAEEWLQFIQNDRELDLAGVNGKYFAYWYGPSSHPEPWFDWFEGNVYTKSPDDPIIEKMVEMAKELNAKVQGDDGEIYLGGGVILNGPKVAEGDPVATRKSWWRRLWEG